MKTKTTEKFKDLIYSQRDQILQQIVPWVNENNLENELWFDMWDKFKDESFGNLRLLGDLGNLD